MITYICGTNGIHYREFPKAFWEEVRTLMNNGDEILLGDSDFDYRVYGRCRSRQYEKVSVMRLVPPKHRYPMAHIKYAMPANIKMMKTCDRMIAVWDGESEEVFVNMLLIVALNKKCRLYRIPSGACAEISTIDDLKPYISECHGWTNDDIRDVLRRCGFSEEMIKYNIEACNFCESYIAEIICKAPVSLKAKTDMLLSLRKKNSIKYDSFTNVSKLMSEGADFEHIRQTICDAIGDFGICFDDCCAAIRNAEFDLKYNDLYEEQRIYCLFDQWYDPDIFFVKSEPSGVFKSMKDVMEYIKREEEYENDYWDDDDDDEEPEEGYPIATWYKLEVWNLRDDGAWETFRYDYYIYKGEVCWFEELHLQHEKNGYKYYSACDSDRAFLGGLLDLNMPTPFKPGDIVYIDCYPFGPSFHAMITEAHAQYDCCMPQILFKMPYTDKWKLEALKHKRFYKEAESHSYEPALSPLYRIRYVSEDELRDSDDLLIRLSKELNGDEDKARAFWDVFHHESRDGVSAEEVLKAWESVNSSEKPND